MKKIISFLLAVLMIAALSAVNVSAWEEWEDPVESGWTRYSIFDETYVELVDKDGVVYPFPASYPNGKADDSFQFWKDAVHLYEGRGLNVYNGAQIVITFFGTGIRLCTCYRNNGGFQVSDIVASLDGFDVTYQLTDLVAPTDNNTAHTPILSFSGLEEEEHVLILTCYSNVYRFSVDYFELENFIPGEQDTEPETEPATEPEKTPETAPETKPETKSEETEPTATAAPAVEKESDGIVPIIIIVFCAVIIALFTFLIIKEKKGQI